MGRNECLERAGNIGSRIRSPVRFRVGFGAELTCPQIIHRACRNLIPPAQGGKNQDRARMRLSIYFNVHLVSDSTGETLNAVMRAAAAQFDRTIPLEHNYYLVRSERQLDRVMAEIEAAPGVVWYTVSDENLRRKLEQFCGQRGIQTLPVLDPSIVLLGVSRTSKTPTCVYLANRGVKAGNIPLVPGIPLPSLVEELKHPMVVGLKIGVERLLQIRSQRLMSLNEKSKTDYVDEEAVRAEVTEASRLFQRNKWPVIDVSRRSVEETAAAILNKLNERRGFA